MDEPNNPQVFPGVTLRDLFAWQTISGMAKYIYKPGYQVAAYQLMAQRAYEIADAMLKQRSK